MKRENTIYTSLMYMLQWWLFHIPRSSYLERQLKLQEFGIAGSSVAIQFGISWVPLDGFCIMLHGLGIVPYIRKNGTFFKKARGYLLPPEHIYPAVSQGPEALRHHPSQSATVWAARTFLKTFVALVLLLQSQVRVYVGQSLLFLQDFLCLRKNYA